MSSSYSQGSKNASKPPKNNSGQHIPPLVSLPRRQNLNLDDLRAFEPGRLDLQWITPSQRLDDQFFTEHYASVASNIKQLVKNLFRCGDLPPDGSVWATTRKHHGEKFHLERIVGMVARPDPMDPTPWEDLMTSKAKRFCVMRAVIMLVLEEQVFSELLFGATKKQSEQLHAQDSDYCHDGGEPSLRTIELNRIADEVTCRHPTLKAQINTCGDDARPLSRHAAMFLAEC